MRLFLFSFWYLPDNRTAVNRIKYFKKTFLRVNTDVKLIYCDDNSSNADIHEDTLYKVPHTHRFYKISNYLIQKNWLFLYKIVHFFYLISSKRDVYDFYRNYRAIESTKAYNIGKDDVIITSAPPYSALNIGYYLKQKYGAKWIVDYRDPWTLGYPTLGFSVFADKIRKLIQRKDELKFLEAADYIITVSESLKKTFPEKFHHKIEVVPNGANTDEMELSKINASPSTFSIVYAGTIHFQQLENNYFFSTVQKFIREQNIQPANFKIHFIGTSDSSELKSIISNFGLQDFVNITDRISLPELYDYMYQASMFLHLKYGNRDKIITSKQYDYLAMQKPILLPETDNGDIAESIIANDAGYVCKNKEELYFILQEEYSKFIDNVDVRIYKDYVFVNGLSRNAASNKLLNLVYSNWYSTDSIKQTIEEIIPQTANGTV